MSESKVTCPHCSQHINLDSIWSGRTLTCPACQKPFTVPEFAPAPQAPPTGEPAPVPGALRWHLVPTAAPHTAAHAVPKSGAYPGRQAVSARSRLCGLAIASLVLSLLGFLFITAIAGVICGHGARKRIRNDASLSGGGLAMAGLIIGYLMIALSVGGGMKFAFDVQNRANEIKAQKTIALTTNAAPIVLASNAAVGVKVRSDIPVPADAVSGTIKSEPFKYTRSSLAQSTGSLEIDGREFMTEGVLVDISLSHRASENLENRTWHITTATARGAEPSVFIIKLHAGSSTKDIIASGYEMELTTGAITGGVQTQVGNVSKLVGGTISGTITLKVNGAEPVDIQGNFTAMYD